MPGTMHALPERLLILLISVTMVSEVVADAVTGTPPNVVLLMGDDHGREETGYTGHPHVQTPVLDEMAATALRFDRFYAHPNCSPTRGGFLTGRHPNRYGTFAPGWSIRPEEITIAHVMKAAGYRCGHFGKWHVGTVRHDSPLNPGAMGFHEWLSHDNFFELNPSLSRNGGAPEVFPGESSEILIAETIRFIRESTQSETPFFAVVWFGSPHEPYSGLPEDLALYDELPNLYRTRSVRLTSNETGGQVTRLQGEVLRERYAEITAMDRSIGNLRQFLADNDLRDNTLLFYCGDNGTSADGALASPHRGVKSEVYEGGILVPGLLEWPARISAPRSTQVRACVTDLLPTLCAITKQPLSDRPLDGIDLSPILDGTLSERPTPLHFWMFNPARLESSNPRPYIDPILQSGTTPLVKLMDGRATRDFKNFHHPPLTGSDYSGARAIIDGSFKLVLHERGGTSATAELFHLDEDPGETQNIAELHPDIVSRLRQSMRDWQSSVLQSLLEVDYHR